MFRVRILLLHLLLIHMRLRCKLMLRMILPSMLMGRMALRLIKLLLRTLPGMFWMSPATCYPAFHGSALYAHTFNTSALHAHALQASVDECGLAHARVLSNLLHQI